METFDFDAPKGGSTAYVAKPAGEATKGVIIIQEYWGVNDNIKDIAGRYAKEGYLAVVPDLYRGQVTKDKNEASKLMQELETEDGLSIIQAALDKTKEDYGIAKFGITGFCMGGTFALRAACAVEGLSASAPFYGDIPDEETLKNLRCPVLFISGKKDQWINPEKVAELERIAKKNFLPVESVAYDADHAFFNNTRPEVYDEEAAKDAWKRVLEFFGKHLQPVHVELNEIHPEDI